MLYQRNTEPSLSEELFRNPTCEYRGTPFWAWNGELDEAELLRQIEFFKQMGLGGFHMHVRSGMSTKYLSDQFMALIRACVDKAKKEEMLAWLYDEDRWPSGAAGGLVTKDKKYRIRHLHMTTDPDSTNTGLKLHHGREDGKTETLNERVASGDAKLISCYDIVLDAEGCLKKAAQIDAEAEAEGTKWYAFLEIVPTSPWWNNQSYLNTLDKAAVDQFIATTHDRYAEIVGDEFDKTVPAIFTDEPQFAKKDTLAFPDEKKDVILAWTDDLPDTFRAAYGQDLVAHLPELFWELPNGAVSTVRYHYHDHITERFSEAFCDNVGKWCADHGIALTGHVMAEQTLATQTQFVGEAMRTYRGFELPGIDMLCSAKEYTTAKQAQSAAHQYGREGVMSELYGVTGWTFDFRGHKLNGDWQAALGVTIRVPHLSWYTMKGEAKRDYPASIHYQSTWGTEYRLVEDHFARVNTALTRGKPVVRVGVIHPIESFWLHWGPSQQTGSVRAQMDRNFANVTEWLLNGAIDFDYIDESLLPALCAAGSAPLKVGEMAYDVVIVPECETLRSTTLERLEQFRAAGGRLIFLGKAPTLENAEPSARGKQLFDRSEQILFAQTALLDSLEDVRVIDLHNLDTGARTENLIYQLRDDTDCKWLFLAHSVDAENPDIARKQRVRLEIRGMYRPELYDTQTGEIKKIGYTAENGITVIDTELYEYDSLLLRLTAGEGALAVGRRANRAQTALRLPDTVPYSLDEPNVLLLDKAEFALDGGAFEPEEELLRAFGVCCKKLGLDWENAHTVQPWVYGKEEFKHTATLRFTVKSRIVVSDAKLALENAALSQIRVNGETVPTVIDGYFTDREIETVALPALHVGTNIIEVDTPIGNTTGLEWCYLLGSFGVQVNGRARTLVALPEELGFNSITMQQLPYYGADVTYHVPVTANGGELTVTVPHYRGGLVRVALDGNDCGAIIYPPYRLSLGKVAPGTHTVDIKLFGNRQNCFGPVHQADERLTWIGPGAWRTSGDTWTYEYRLSEIGLLSSPIIEESC